MRSRQILDAPEALIVNSFSKYYSMAGWRLGFCAGNAEMVRALATIKGYYDYGIFQALQIAAIIALRHCDELVERQAKEYEKRRAEEREKGIRPKVPPAPATGYAPR